MTPNLAIITELMDQYEQGWTPPPTEYPNEPFTRPTTLWARLNIYTNEEKQVDFGGEKKNFRTDGVLIVQLFAPLDEGIIPVHTQAGLLAEAFRQWKGPSVRCNGVTVRAIGNDGAGWYQVNVVIPFKQDALH